VVPLLARVYPNGQADVNAFQAAGGPGFIIRELLDAGLMHEDVLTVREGGMREYTRIPALGRALTPALSQGEREQGSGLLDPLGEEQGHRRPLPLAGEGGGEGLRWEEIGPSKDLSVVRPSAEPFGPTGGLKLLTGNLGRSVIKVSAVPEDRHVVEAPSPTAHREAETAKAHRG